MEVREMVPEGTKRWIKIKFCRVGLKFWIKNTINYMLLNSLDVLNAPRWFKILNFGSFQTHAYPELLLSHIAKDCLSFKLELC